MLSGWRLLEGFGRSPSESSLDSPEAVMLQALYDYQYKSEDGRQVSIAEGEIFQLMHKTNEDWWQVRRLGQSKQKRPFFVPATYVAEIPSGARAAAQQNTRLRHGITADLHVQFAEAGNAPIHHRCHSHRDYSELASLAFVTGRVRYEVIVTTAAFLSANEHCACSGGAFILTPVCAWSGCVGNVTLLSFSHGFSHCSHSPRKCWAPSWLVLAGNSLMFYKEPKVATAWTPFGTRPESSVDLRGARIEWARDLSSKRNVIHFRTVTGNEYLLQSDSETVSQDWYQAIKGVIRRLDEENPLDEPLLYPLYRSNSADLVDLSADEEDDLGLPKGETQKRVKSKLRRFIAKRPPLQSLQEKGLIRDQVFGCRLEALCQREGSTVPRFVRQCVEAVEQKGLDADGIYRVSGNLAIIQKLRFIVDRERAVTSDGRYVFPEQRCHEDKLHLTDPQWDDVHVITGALKLFFRELPEPLVPYSLFDEFIAAVKLPDLKEKISKLAGLIQIQLSKLPVSLLCYPVLKHAACYSYQTFSVNGSYLRKVTFILVF
uniref:Rho GTPase activating protein 9 n=1 Tax=Varanus komodoensis TaxID=61221 RepID=A0A8D2J8B6_VARKO